MPHHCSMAPVDTWQQPTSQGPLGPLALAEYRAMSLRVSGWMRGEMRRQMTLHLRRRAAATAARSACHHAQRQGCSRPATKRRRACQHVWAPGPPLHVTCQLGALIKKALCRRPG